LRDLEQSLRADGVRPVVVRPGRSGKVLWEERDDRHGTFWCRESGAEPQSIAAMVGAIKPIHAHVHHCLGLPDSLFRVLADCGVRHDWTIHDFHAICPRINLVGSGDRYCGEPDEDGCNRCLARLGDDQGRPVSESIAEWRHRSAARLASARRVFAPSADVARRLRRYFPGRELTLRPHAEAFPRLKLLAAPVPEGGVIRVVVIGTLVAVKGSERLLDCARDARLRDLPLEFHVIGSTDRDAELLRVGNVRITGRYRESDVFDLIALREPHLALLPSQCPESHMYTLSIAMAAGLFVVCFDLGAQAERVRSWGWGRPIELELTPAAINDVLIAAARSLEQHRHPPPPPEPAFYPDILISYYEFTEEELSRMRGTSDRENRSRGSRQLAVSGRAHAHFH
jgi:glycosyltransferase involved in cell wall biosynthesis